MTAAQNQPPPPVTPRMQTEFTVSAWNGLIDELIATLDQHPDAVHWTDSSGHNGLMNAVAHGSHKFDVAELMLACGANVNAQDVEGNTAFHILARQRGGGYEDYAELLLDNGADLSIRNRDGKTPVDVMQDDQKEKFLKFIDDGWGAQRRMSKEERAQEQARALEKEVAVAHAGISRPLPILHPAKIRRPQV